MNWKHNLRRTTLTFLSAGLLALSGLGAAASPAQTPPAGTSACGTGDHGLLQDLRQQLSVKDQAPLAFSDISFLSANTGRAVGNGFMIGTSDGGCHFQEIYQGQWNFKQISFPDNVHGWALASVGEGPANYLITTTDGGSTWKNLSGTAVAFDRIGFTDSRNGFAYSRTSTYTTKDGGLNWSKVPTPANTRGAYFSNRSNGWAIVVAPGTGYRLMKTTDGGFTWKLSLKAAFDGPEGGQIYAKGNQVYAVLYGGTGMSQTSYSLYASGDKGGVWNRVIAQTTAGGGPAPGSGPAQFKFGPASGKPGDLELVGNNTAFLVGFSPAAEQVAVGRSEHGGKQWSNWKSIPGFDAVISFTDGQQGWIAVRGVNQSSLYATGDGGSTWKVKLTLNNQP
jgi:photosystem II stability/assembly factor-like uncharacterized protein